MILSETQVSEMIDRAISRQWTGGPSTRNGIRDAVRSVVKASWAQGSIDAEQRDRLLDAIRPEKLTAAKDAQGHRHGPAATIASSFAALRLDPSPTARRDAALIATLVGCGLRRQEAVDIDLDQFDGDQLCRVVGRGGTLRDVPCPAGVRRAIVQWTTARGSEPGPLFTSMDRHRVPSLGRLATDTVRQIVERRVGTDVSSHMLRGTWVGDLLDAGSDLSVVSKMAGHKSPSTTARYDRRGSVARKAAADLLTVPFMAFELDAGGEG